MLFLSMMLLAGSGRPLPYPAQPDIYLSIHTTQNYRGGVYFFSPHENEHVINDYLIAKVNKRGGWYAILRQNGERHISLHVNDRHIEVDPNRIFTAAGALSTVTQLNPWLTQQPELRDKAADLAYDLGRFILRQIPLERKDTVLVAVHNNTDGFDGDGKNGVGTISMVRYQKKLNGGAKYIKKLHHGSGDEDDLFFITREAHFKALSSLGWNLVLQHPQVGVLAEEDDGSLSVLAEKLDRGYLNIEAQRKHDDGRGADHLSIQMKMVDAVFNLLY